MYTFLESEDKKTWTKTSCEKGYTLLDGIDMDNKTCSEDYSYSANNGFRPILVYKGKLDNLKEKIKTPINVVIRDMEDKEDLGVLTKEELKKLVLDISSVNEGSLSIILGLKGMSIGNHMFFSNKNFIKLAEDSEEIESIWNMLKNGTVPLSVEVRDGESNNFTKIYNFIKQEKVVELSPLEMSLVDMEDREDLGILTREQTALNFTAKNNNGKCLSVSYSLDNNVGNGGGEVAEGNLGDKSIKLDFTYCNNCEKGISQEIWDRLEDGKHTIKIKVEGNGTSLEKNYYFYKNAREIILPQPPKKVDDFLVEFTINNEKSDSLKTNSELIEVVVNNIEADNDTLKIGEDILKSLSTNSNDTVKIRATKIKDRNVSKYYLTKIDTDFTKKEEIRNLGGKSEEFNFSFYLEDTNKNKKKTIITLDDKVIETIEETPLYQIKPCVIKQEVIDSMKKKSEHTIKISIEDTTTKEVITREFMFIKVNKPLEFELVKFILEKPFDLIKTEVLEKLVVNLDIDFKGMSESLTFTTDISSKEIEFGLVNGLNSIELEFQKDVKTNKQVGSFSIKMKNIQEMNISNIRTYIVEGKVETLVSKEIEVMFDDINKVNIISGKFDENNKKVVI